MENIIYHFGIKGMKWGVRRYQNKDGTLTAAGKKKYYRDGGRLLTNEGSAIAAKNSKKLYQKSTKIAKKISKDKDYKDAAERLSKARTKNKQSYAEEFEKWGKQTDFKNMDYYQFKQTVSDRWFSSKDGKEELAATKNLRNIIEKKVEKQLGKDAFNQSLPNLINGRSVNVGKTITDRILNSEYYKNG